MKKIQGRGWEGGRKGRKTNSNKESQELRLGHVKSQVSL